jgi:hypothetical protein
MLKKGLLFTVGLFIFEKDRWLLVNFDPEMKSTGEAI